MNDKRLLIIGTIILASLGLVMLLATSNDAEPAAQAAPAFDPQEKQSPALAATVAAAPIAPAAAACANMAPHPLSAVVLRQVLDESPSEAMRALTFYKPADVLEKAEAGDADATLAYFTVAMSCASFTPGEAAPLISGCPAGLSRDEAFRLLNLAAEKGDIVAQTAFALNAPTRADMLARGGSNESVAEAVRLRKLSEHFASLAAEAGSEEAMSFLARAYLHGTYGARDREKAYLYLLPLSTKYQSPVVTDLLDSVKKTLTPGARLAAERAVFGCKDSSSEIVSPFRH
jgi:TPR repeat protein